MSAVVIGDGVWLATQSLLANALQRKELNIGALAVLLIDVIDRKSLSDHPGWRVMYIYKIKRFLPDGMPEKSLEIVSMKNSRIANKKTARNQKS